MDQTPNDFQGVTVNLEKSEVIRAMHPPKYTLCQVQTVMHHGPLWRDKETGFLACEYHKTKMSEHPVGWEWEKI